MERAAIIKKFLSFGYQLDGASLDFLSQNEEKIDKFLEKIKRIKAPPTISIDILKNISSETTPPQKISTNNTINIFNQRYKKIKSMFYHRLDLINLISINKITPKTQKFSIVGLVEEKVPATNTIVLEDESGHVEIVLNNELFSQIIEDEIIGTVCERTNTTISCKKIIFPDVPFGKEPKKTTNDEYCFFVSDIHMDSNLFNKAAFEKFHDWLEKQEKTNIFILGDISSNKKDVDQLLEEIPKKHKIFYLRGEIDPKTNYSEVENPSLFTFENVNLFLFHNHKINYYIDMWGPDAITNLLKKRHLDPYFSLPESSLVGDPYLLEKTPDIVVAAHTHIPSSTIYKNITILTTGSFVSQPIFWLINLRTRETFKIDFS